MKKGVSPLIAEILLIGFTVAIASIIILWSTSFTKTTTKTIGSQAETQMACTYGGIDFYGTITYNSTSQAIYGYIRNTGNIPLGNITFQIVYKNGNIDTKTLQLDALLPSAISSFYFDGISSNIDLIYVFTNCTNPPVSAKLSVGEINFVS
jgi:hypothetical protein